MTFRPFKVIQGHLFWYQSKARTRHSNLGTRDIAGFCSHDCTIFYPVLPYFEGVAVGPDDRWWGQFE